MSDNKKLKSKLSKLVDTERDAADNGRRTTFETPADGAMAILEEIEETILSRDLTIVTDRGDRLSLMVKSCRLMRLNVPHPGSVGNFKAVFGIELSASDADQITDIARILFTFCDGASSITSQSSKPATEASLNEAGVAPDQMRKAMVTIGLTTPPPAINPLDPVNTLASQRALAWIRCSGTKMVETSGPTAQIQALANTFSSALPHIHKTDRTADVGTNIPQHWVFGGTGAPLRTTISTCGSEALLALIAAEDLTDWVMACGPAR